MTSDRLVDQLEDIASNLWWCWQPDVWRIFRDLDPGRWNESHHNPVAVLEGMTEEALLERTDQRALASRIRNAHRRLVEYRRSSGPEAHMRAAPLHAAPVAYFCAEFCLHESLPIYSGGLGVLAGDHLKSASDLAIPIVGIGLFYHHGYFDQSIDDDGWQQASQGEIETELTPLEKVRGGNGEPLTLEVPGGEGGTIRAHAWQAEIGRNRLYLLDANVDANHPADRELSGQLYGGDRRMRIRQEALLGVGGMRLLEELGIEPGVYHLNEGHCAFAPLERCAQLMEDRQNLSFEEAQHRVARQSVFTTHTPVPAGHDRFPIEMYEDELGWLRERLGLSHRDFHGLGRVDLDDPDESFCMTVLGIKMSDHRNGVSHIHGRVSREMWEGLWPHLDRPDRPIGHITNGIHVSSFLAPEMRSLFDRHLDPGWEQAMDDPETWEQVEEIPAGDMWETHQTLKSDLLDFIDQQVPYQDAPDGSESGEIVPGSGFEPDILTVGFARRFALYKRADLILRDRERFKSMLTDEERPIQIVYAGKAHPEDDHAKELIREIVELTVDPEFAGRIVFLADYDLYVARRMIQGVDVWLNNPRRPQEACGTSGQKCVFNGVLNCSVLDGWWAEAYDGRNGFAIGSGSEYLDPAAQDERDAEALYRVLEDEVLPLYYDVDEDGTRRRWTQRVKWAIRSLAWRFNADRMLGDYLREAYLPAAEVTSTEM